MQETTRKAIAVIGIVAETIRELKEVPSGHLYANIMTYMDLKTFERIIDTLKKAKLVEERNHLLKWIGPDVNG